MTNIRNPVLPPDICIPDGEAHVFGDRLYVYGSCDQENNTYCSTSYYVASTADMQNWTVHDLAFSGKDIPWAAPWGRHYPVVDMNMRNPTPTTKKMYQDMHIPVDHIPKCIRPRKIKIGKYIPSQQKYLFAPDCAYHDGKYYLYFCTGGYQEGVAVSDKPEGPFRDPVQLPCGGIDPAVFIDDDGSAYYYWGQFRASAVKLNADMLSFNPRNVVPHVLTEEEHGFHEGSSMRKRNGIYYFIYPCILRGGRPTALAYATASHPLGPFTYRGIIIDNAKCDPDSWNIHGSIEYFNGQWYVFYHRSSQNSRFHRRLCVEPIFFNSDGSINEVKMTSTASGEPFRQGETIEGWRACEVEGGAYIDGKTLMMAAGSKATFRYVKFHTPVTKIHVQQDRGAAITALVDGQPVNEAKPGVYTLTLVSENDTVIHSICFE